MSSKKRKSPYDPENLSGGTGNVNPESMLIYMNVPWNLSNATEAVTSQVVSMPVPRYPGSNNRAIVTELLGIHYYLMNPGIPQTLVAVGNGGMQYVMYLTTSNATGLGEQAVAKSPQTIWMKKVLMWASSLSTSANNLVASYSDPHSGFIDFTDEAGHGILLGTDQIEFGVAVANNNVSTVMGVNQKTDGTPGVRLGLEYRLKEVPLSEYIGIVQSQQ